MRFLKNKTVLAGISVAVAAAILTTVFVTLRHNSEGPVARLDSNSASSARTASVPPITKPSGEVSSEKAKAGAQETAALDVGGNPVKQTAAGGTTATNQNGSVGAGASKSGTASKVSGPSASVTQHPDGTQSKSSTANPNNPADGTADGWAPPAPGEGLGPLISEGFESVAVNIDPSVEKLQCEVAFQAGSDLPNAGYNTLYPNGAPDRLVEDAIAVYAKTGVITLNPSSYGLPGLVAKIPASGSNAKVAGDYVANHMVNDPIFNEKVRTTFNVCKDGWLSVYQKDGFFYILFAVVDKGYSSFG